MTLPLRAQPVKFYLVMGKLSDGLAVIEVAGEHER